MKTIDKYAIDANNVKNPKTHIISTWFMAC